MHDTWRKEQFANKRKTDKAVLERLVKQAKRGERDALKTLCVTISKSVLFRAMSRLHNRMDAEDVTQEVLIRVCKSIQKLKDPKTFGAWLNTIIVNEIRRYTAKKSKSASILSMEEYLGTLAKEDEDYLPEEYVMRKEDHKAIMKIVNELPERQWEAVMLYYYEGISITKIAMEMKVSKPTVINHLTRAREKIKEELSKQMEKTGTFNGIALLPVGGLLTNVLYREAEQTPSISEAWIEQMAGKYAEYIVGGTAAIAAKGSAALAAGSAMSLPGLLIGGMMIFVMATMISMGLFTGNLVKPIEDSSQPRVEAVITEGEIVFSGGDAQCENLNPTQATVWASNERGDLMAQNWWITALDSEEVLYSGEGGTVEEALTYLLARNEDGEYLLSFTMEDAGGRTYTLARSFIVQVPRDL